MKTCGWLSGPRFFWGGVSPRQSVHVGFGKGQYGIGGGWRGFPAHHTIQHMCCIQRSTTMENVLTARKTVAVVIAAGAFVCGSRGVGGGGGRERERERGGKYVLVRGGGGWSSYCQEEEFLNASH